MYATVMYPPHLSDYNDSNMAESTENNPFSFKSFVKSKDPKVEKSHEQKISKNYPLNQRKEKIIEDDSPFPEVSTSLGKLFAAAAVSFTKSICVGGETIIFTGRTRRGRKARNY